MDDILFSAPSILETQHMFDIAQLCLRKARAAVTGKLSAAERSYPTSEVRGRSREDPHARRAAAKRSYPTSEVRGSGQECQAETAQEWPRRATQVQGRGGGREELPHDQGAVAMRAQEGLEELSHDEGQEGWR